MPFCLKCSKEFKTLGDMLDHKHEKPKHNDFYMATTGQVATLE